MNSSEAKELLQGNLDFLQSLSVPEYTLYRKWVHMNTLSLKKWNKDNFSIIKQVKKNIWTPKDVNDYENLNIDVIPADNKKTLLI